MYLTFKETAEYLDLPEELIRQLVLQKRIRALYDGEQYLINKEQFNHHLDQMEKLKIQWEEEAQEPIPDDIDYKDED